MTKAWKSKFLTAILFTFCGIPGILAFAYCSILLLGHFIDPRNADKLPSQITLATISAIGLFLALIGAGKLRQWRYALVFLSIPASLILIGLLEYVFNIASGKGYWEISLTGIMAVLVYKYVRQSYNIKHRSEGDE